MDYKQDDFYRVTKNGSQKMPFYMTYPMQNIFLEEAEYERDMNRLKSLFPEEVRGIQQLVEEECDKMEYEGSLMFDEYPDRLMLRQICNRIQQKLMETEGANTVQDMDFEAEQYEQLEAEEIRMIDRRRPPRAPEGPPHFGPPGSRPPQRPGSGPNNLIEVLLFHEMYHRRCRHRRCQRWW